MPPSAPPHDPAAPSRGSHASQFGNLHNFYDALPAAVQRDLDAVSSFRNVPRDHTVRRAGEPPEHLYQVQDGRVKYSACDYQGRESVLTFMTRGDWIGLSELFTGLPASWDVIAVSPVRLRVIRKADFDAQMDRHPVIARQLLATFSLRFRLFDVFGLDHSPLSLKERVLKVLYMMSFSRDHDAGDDHDIVLTLSQEELSKVVGSSRQKLNGALKALQQEGMIAVRYGAICLHRRDRVRQHYGRMLDSHSGMG